MLTLRLYMLQRVAALVMVPLVIGHIVVMILAVQGGLTVAEILSRTQGSLFWMQFYGLFVLAVSIHAAIGLRVIVHELTGLNGRFLDVLSWGIFVGLTVLGAQAVFAVTWL